MDEVSERFKKNLQYLKDENTKELAANRNLIDAFIEHCNHLGIFLGEESITYIPMIGLVASYPGLLGYLSTEIKPDKEGLIDFSYLNTVLPRRQGPEGYLWGPNYMAMASPYFRREYGPSSHYTPRFIDLFWKFNDPAVNQYISLDFNRVRINLDRRQPLVEDTWYGSGFDRTIAKIPDGVVKLRPPTDLKPFMVDFLFKNTYSLDIKWETTGIVRVFKAEEFKNDETTVIVDGSVLYPVRYVHAEFDISLGHFRHFDGAIHFYSKDEYFTRRDSDLNYNSKNSVQIKTHSQKLFKLNGKIEIETFIELTCHFLFANPLVFEYFQGSYPAHISDMIDALRKSAELEDDVGT
jgi:hypothetical protein